jgi:hypothetical protein
MASRPDPRGCVPVRCARRSSVCGSERYPHHVLVVEFGVPMDGVATAVVMPYPGEPQ